jgi:hypothetical protein
MAIVIRILLADWMRDNPIILALTTIVRAPPPRSWLNWANLGAVIALASFLWLEYQDYLVDKKYVDSRIVSLTDQIDALKSQINTMRELETVRHTGEQNQLNDLSKRIDIHRDDIRSLQQQVNSHFDKMK